MSGKVKYHELPEKERKKYLEDFYSMVSLLKTKEEVENFLKDLLTLSEVVMISRRIQVAKKLLMGKTHEEIKKELKIGYTTISQVERWLHNGFGGYKSVIRKYEKTKKGKNGVKGDYDPEDTVPFSPGWVRKKYPLHSLLLDLLDDKK